MRITREEAAQLGRKIGAAMAKAAPLHPVKAPGELLAIFVPGPLRNPSNGSYVHWSKHRKWAKDWRDRVAMALFEEKGRDTTVEGFLRQIEMPKRVAFLANVHTLFDDDNLQSALKPVRDGLVDCGVIHGDGPKDGHVFEYAQQIDRKNRGVTIRVSLMGAP